MALTTRWPQALCKLVEDAANGPAVISALGLKARGLSPVKPQGGKLPRAQAILPLVAAANVWLPDPREQPWAPPPKAHGEVIARDTTRQIAAMVDGDELRECDRSGNDEWG